MSVLSVFYLVGITVVLWTLVQAYRRRRIPYGRGFFRLLYADRDSRPVLFWLMVIGHIIIGLALVRGLVLGLGHIPR